MEIPVLCVPRNVGTHVESTSREREDRYKRGRSKDSKSSLQSEDVMWTEPTPVAMVVDDLCVAVKFQSNSEIAGSPRNSFRASVSLDYRR